MQSGLAWVQVHAGMPSRLPVRLLGGTLVSRTSSRLLELPDRRLGLASLALLVRPGSGPRRDFLRRVSSLPKPSCRNQAFITAGASLGRSAEGAGDRVCLWVRLCTCAGQLLARVEADPKLTLQERKHPS